MSYCIGEYDLLNPYGDHYKFDLETTQRNAVNAFIYYDLNKVIYIKLPPGFNRKKDKVLRLRKALYGL